MLTGAVSSASAAGLNRAAVLELAREVLPRLPLLRNLSVMIVDHYPELDSTLGALISALVGAWPLLFCFTAATVCHD